MATMSLGSRPSTLQARTATSKARQLSSPPEIPSNSALGVGVLHALGKALSLDAQNQLAALGASSIILRHKWRGGDKPRQRRSLPLAAAQSSTVVYPAVIRHKGCVAAGAPAPCGQGPARSRRYRLGERLRPRHSSVPFSAIRLWAAKVISVVLSPWPASA